MDNNDANRNWAEGYLDLIHQYIWEYKISRSPNFQFPLPESEIKDPSGIFS